MRLRWLKRGKTLHCYHLVIIKAAVCVQFFAALGRCLSAFALRCELLSMMFLICSIGVLCSLHEPSILSCPQAPAGHGALRTGGCDTFSRACGRHRKQATARPRRAIQRERPVRGRSAGRLRRWLAEPGRTAAVQDDGDARYLAQGHHPQQLARHRLRPFDQSLSRLRAWLRLLLRAADPRLSRTVAGARFRIQAARQAGRAGTAREGTGRAGLRAAHDRDRHQHRSLSADRARIQNHARHSRSAGARRPSRRHRHQIGAGDARHRYSAADGEAQSGQGRAFR